MWKELIQSLTDEAEFSAPAALADIAKAERALGVSLPQPLKDLLGESNGVAGEYGLGLVWPVEQIVQSNLEFRRSPDFKELYMPFAPLLFFADAGNGDQFAFTILDGAIRRPDVFAWNHEDDSRTWIAPSLQKYLEWSLGGQLKL